MRNFIKYLLCFFLIASPFLSASTASPGVIYLDRHVEIDEEGVGQVVCEGFKKFKCQVILL